MVQRQVEKWPYHDSKCRFTMKTTMDRMCGVLLNRVFGFMREVKVMIPLPVPGTPGPPDGLEAQSDEDRDDSDKMREVRLGGMQDGDDGMYFRERKRPRSAHAV